MLEIAPWASCSPAEGGSTGRLRKRVGAGVTAAFQQPHLCLLQAEPSREDCVSDAEKAAMDLKDPNRPRFTLQELRDVLHERNELKSKVFLLQEELAYYKR